VCLVQLTLSVRLVECDRAPDVAVTVSIYVPAGVPGARDAPPPHEQQQNPAVNRSIADNPSRPVQAIPRRIMRRTARSPMRSSTVTRSAAGGAIGEMGACGTTNADAVVGTLMIKGTASMPSIFTTAGETEHDASAGAPAHANVIV
jgi:hypothetical protein